MIGRDGRQTGEERAGMATSEETVESARPARARGGRQARQAQRSGARAAPIIAGIRRAIPAYELMSEEGLARIEAGGRDAAAGDRHRVPRRRRARSSCGARPAPTSRASGCASSPGCVARDRGPRAGRASSTMPATRRRSVEVGGNDVVFSPAYGSPFVHDLDGAGATARSSISATS
jgi:trimethylamine--corrinoid protein Co-methyltransferase